MDKELVKEFIQAVNELIDPTVYNDEDDLLRNGEVLNYLKLRQRLIFQLNQPTGCTCGQAPGNCSC